MPAATVQEKATLASYGWGVFSKGKRFVSSMGYLYRDVERLTDSRLTRIFMQTQAIIFPWSNQAQAAATPIDGAAKAASYIDFGSLYNTFKEHVNYITNHPISVFSRGFFFCKQTLDFGIATVQWGAGYRTSKSLLNHGVNTALAYIPFFAASHALGESLPAQLAINAMTIACLAYSIRQDFVQSANKKEREASPSISLIRTHALPHVQKLAQKILG